MRFTNNAHMCVRVKVPHRLDHPVRLLVPLCHPHRHSTTISQDIITACDQYVRVCNTCMTRMISSKPSIHFQAIRLTCSLSDGQVIWVCPSTTRAQQRLVQMYIICTAQLSPELARTYSAIRDLECTPTQHPCDRWPQSVWDRPMADGW
jgi:hypothetical protein